MDQYLVLINKKKEELAILKDQLFELEKKCKAAHCCANQSKINYFSLNEEIFDLENKKTEFLAAPHHLKLEKKEKLNRGIITLALSFVLTVLLKKPGTLSLATFISQPFVIGSIMIVSYFIETRSTRKK